MIEPFFRPTEKQAEQVAACLLDLVLVHSWSVPFAMGTMALYKDATGWGVLVYWDDECRQGRIFRPVLPPDATFERQLAEVGRLLSLDRAEAEARTSNAKEHR
jgi:hypothetical protein